MFEWNESVVTQDANFSRRGKRGGAFFGYDSYLRASFRANEYPSVADYAMGFRISYIPEPTTLGLMALASLTLLRRRTQPCESI